MHGHQIRREAVVDRTELWADVKPGSLYAALHRLAAEDLVEVVRTEQEGNLPARTVYAITDQGRRELAALRDQVLRDPRLRPDPVDLALALHNTSDLTEQELRALLEGRRTSLAAQLASWQRQRETADPHLTGLEPMTFHHTLLRLQTELAWHDQLLEELSTLLHDPDQSG
jgi:DNA-binding PadR family transcriptional regulator